MAYVVRFLAPLFLLLSRLEGFCRHYGKNEVALLKAPSTHQQYQLQILQARHIRPI